MFRPLWVKSRDSHRKLSPKKKKKNEAARGKTSPNSRA